MPSNASKTKSLKKRDITVDKNKSVFSQRLNDLLIKDTDDFIMTGEELARRANISAGIISGYRQGNHSPKLSHLKQISDTLNVSTDYLVGVTPYKTTDEDIKTACKTTGLSVDAIIALKNLVSNCTLDERVRAEYPEPDFDGMINSAESIADPTEQKKYIGFIRELLEFEKKLHNQTSSIVIHGELALIAINSLLTTENGIIALKYLGILFSAKKEAEAKTLAFASLIDLFSKIRNEQECETDGERN